MITTAPAGSPRLPSISERAWVQAQCTAEAMTSTVNLGGWAHRALKRSSLAAQRDVWAEQRPGLAKVLEGGMAARMLGHPLTAPLDYLVGTGASAPEAPGVRALWRLVQRGDAPAAHAERKAALNAQNAYDTTHPAGEGVLGELFAFERIIRVRLGAGVLGIVGAGLGAAHWCVARQPAEGPRRSLREAMGHGAVWGACAGAVVGTASMAASFTLMALYAPRLGTAAVKGAIVGLGLLGGALNLAWAAAWGPPRLPASADAAATHPADSLPPAERSDSEEFYACAESLAEGTA